MNKIKKGIVYKGIWTCYCIYCRTNVCILVRGETGGNCEE